MKFIVAASVLALAMTQVSATPAPGCLLNHTITATDSCTSVSAQFQITEADFYAMNPGLHHSVTHDCDNLDTGKPFCVCMKSPCPVQESAAPASSGAAVASANSTVATSAAGSASAAVSSAASSAPVSSASAAVSSMASTASSAAASSSPSTSATSNAAAKTVLGAMTAAFVVVATSALL